MSFFEDPLEEIKKRISQLNEWTKDYDEGHPVISDKEWDDAYFKLATLERENNIYLPNSPTQSIDFQVISELKKIKHNHLMLSLDKTKDTKEVENFLNEKNYIAMCKMDGLTCSLRYINGALVSAETRGNGEIGEDILHNALTLKSIPKRIPYTNELIVDGEVICKIDDFKPFTDEYKNPRNFAAGSIRLLDAKECAKRNLTFIAWDVIKGLEEIDNLNNCFVKLKEFGFEPVPFTIMGNIKEGIDTIKDFAKQNNYPIDGVVFKFLSRSYGKTLGATSHHFKNAIAYKFYDETYLTKVKNIEWTMGRTGILTPVAIFEPIDIDGSTVERASLHNLSILKDLGLKYQNQIVEVFKANQIIPQIKKVYPYEGTPVNELIIPEVCPICGGKTKIVKTDNSIILECNNPLCDGKFINRLDHFCGKKGMDIKGLSKTTLEKLINWNWVSTFSDLFTLRNHRIEWIQKPGFGEKSVDKILNAIDYSANNCVIANLIAAIGIPLIGTSASKALAQYFDYSWTKFYNATQSDFKFYELPNFGIEMNNAIISYDYTEINNIINNYLHFSIPELETTNNEILKDLTFVITGKLNHFKNRDILKEKISNLGGKVTDSVSKNTNYLINNDKESQSSKNKKAKILNIPILSEEDFLQTFGIE